MVENETVLCSLQYRPEGDRSTFIHRWSAGTISDLPSDALCLHCFENVHRSSQACMLPTSYTAATDQFSGFGQFCCPSCAIGYAVERNFPNLFESTMMLRMLVRQWGGDANADFGASFPAFLLSKFGGPLSVEEFHRHHETAKVWCCLRQPLVMTTSAVQIYDAKCNRRPKNAGASAATSPPPNPVSQADTLDQETRPKPAAATTDCVTHSSMEVCEADDAGIPPPPSVPSLTQTPPPSMSDDGPEECGCEIPHEPSPSQTQDMVHPVPPVAKKTRGMKKRKIVPSDRRLTQPSLMTLLRRRKDDAPA